MLPTCTDDITVDITLWRPKKLKCVRKRNFNEESNRFNGHIRVIHEILMFDVHIGELHFDQQ